MCSVDSSSFSLRNHLLSKTFDNQLTGQFNEFYEREIKKFEQGVKRVDSFLYTWDSWQFSSPEEGYFDPSVEDVSHSS